MPTLGAKHTSSEARHFVQRKGQCSLASREIPKQIHGCWQGRVSRLKCLSLRTWQLKFQMTFSMTWVPQGDLVVRRAHESSWGSPAPAALMCLTWELPGHRDAGTCSFHSLTKAEGLSQAPRRATGVWPATFLHICLSPTSQCPASIIVAMWFIVYQ